MREMIRDLTRLTSSYSRARAHERMITFYFDVERAYLRRTLELLFEANSNNSALADPPIRESIYDLADSGPMGGKYALLAYTLLAGDNGNSQYPEETSSS